jgi:hypothetical protein
LTGSGSRVGEKRDAYWDSEGKTWRKETSWKTQALMRG